VIADIVAGTIQISCESIVFSVCSQKVWLFKCGNIWDLF